MGPSGFSTPSAASPIRVNGALSLQPYGLRPARSLSTLPPRRYQRAPKTRESMCWGDTLPVARAATSSSALRGAPKMPATLVREMLSPIDNDPTPSSPLLPIWALGSSDGILHRGDRVPGPRHAPWRITLSNLAEWENHADPETTPNRGPRLCGAAVRLRCSDGGGNDLHPRR